MLSVIIQDNRVERKGQNNKDLSEVLFNRKDLFPEEPPKELFMKRTKTDFPIGLEEDVRPIKKGSLPYVLHQVGRNQETTRRTGRYGICET